jgi:hypothetical protein
MHRHCLALSLFMATILFSVSGSAVAHVPPGHDAEPPAAVPTGAPEAAPVPSPPPASLDAPVLPPYPDPPPVVLSTGVPVKPVLLHHSVNGNPLGALVGAFSLNYEYLSDGGYHGLLTEIVSSRLEDEEGTKEESQGASLGYRYHFSGQQQSWFAGLTAGYFAGTGDATIEVSTTTNGVTEVTKTVFPVDFTNYQLTVNNGYRWLWDNGLNVTIRFGLGYGDYTFDTESDSPDAQLAVELVEALLTLVPLAAEGEFSLGYTF